MKRQTLWVVGVCGALLACGSDDDRRRSSSSDGGPNSSATGDASTHAGLDGGDSLELDARTRSGDGAVSVFPANDAGQVLCGSSPCSCSDGRDNDMDGVTDLADPECVSAWDNDESSFATGIAGDNRDDACQDCFFDGNSGSGNDGCRIPSSCLTDGTASSGQGSCNSCTASAQCKNFCQAYTPNGCDCFGCCAVQVGSNLTKNVLLASGCNIDGNVFTGCTECVPSVSCVNACGRCELCPGKTLADLPPDCGSTHSDAGVVLGGGADAGTAAPTPTCDQGETRCGAGLPACTSGEACTFGCCILVPLI
ncbi:MAG: hypothetical protein JWN48_343 [Myxococcaceae bacterium]|nr:hypothetical protein [Myxococcaceae bacterium]